ncbi:HWE histidine kinase domain-containing protein [Rhizobium sp. S152]|uniref:HWE histidine kinase domain-containing protein n=1 Tax=Rhizobium sp. S152 TaxID=3055038 RepID=UPI0025A9567B|nr:HWE histidine kinase domain-containing protein [Rhizobium sp. S152]MDM9628451.1 HWE histidine kinase domain-containing protein [Rhizobium sp. S152]
MHYDRSKVDLTNCDREPIHIPGSIQPLGALIVVEDDSAAIGFVSANIGEFLGDTNHEYHGLTLPEVLGADVAHSIGNAAARAGSGSTAGVVLNASVGTKRSRSDISVHRFEGRTFVELENPAPIQDTEIALHLTQSLVSRIDGKTEFEPLVETAARLIRAMLGYDRVMVYRFLHNGAGRVVAEAKDPGMSSFLGQHFPFSDIPVQARKLYVQSWVRVIGDTGFTPVPLVPALKDGEHPVDMSHAYLRSVSPIHCEYLRNMGVAASMSISIVVEGQLWGLIACHHNKPKWLSIPLRIATELFAQYLSLQVSALESRQQKLSALTTRRKLDAIISDVDPNDPVELSLKKRLREFSSLIACDGAGLWSRGEWAAYGVAPDEHVIPDLMKAVTEKSDRSIWDTQDLASFMGDDNAYGGRVAGLLAIPISAAPRDYLLFFRSEEAHQIEWAGEPKKKVEMTGFGERLTPRGSFETWREDVRGKSVPWTEADLVVADSIRSYVRDVMLSHSDATEEQRERVENQRSLLNAELNHRVKNILALVKSIATQTGVNSATVEDYANSFEGRLRALSYAHDQSFSGTDGGELRSLIDAEAGMHRFAKSPDRIALSGDPVGLTERAFGVFALLLHEMMTNAAKYGSLSVASGHLDVRWHLDDKGDCIIEWTESGGPKVVAPTRRGFGSNLIQKTVSHDLRGSVRLDFDPAGLKARFVIPGEHLHVVAQRENFVDITAPSKSPLLGLTVLLVEDQALIAMDTEELLRGLGAANILVAPDVAKALDHVSATDIDCAVLDLNLGNGTSEPVASELIKRGTPFVFATGYRDSVSIPQGFSDVPVVRKPVSRAILATAFDTVLETQTRDQQS